MIRLRPAPIAARMAISRDRPEARASSIFALVNALGRRDRARALEILDTLTRTGEYLPLALAFSEDAGRLRDGDRVLLAAFGAGFTWGATVIEWGVR